MKCCDLWEQANGKLQDRIDELETQLADMEHDRDAALSLCDEYQHLAKKALASMERFSESVDDYVATRRQA